MLSQGKIGILAMHLHFHYFPQLYKTFWTRGVFSLEGQWCSERMLVILPHLRKRLFVFPTEPIGVTDLHLPSKLIHEVLLWLYTSKSLIQFLSHHPWKELFSCSWPSWPNFTGSKWSLLFIFTYHENWQGLLVLQKTNKQMHNWAPDANNNTAYLSWWLDIQAMDFEYTGEMLQAD